MLHVFQDLAPKSIRQRLFFAKSLAEASDVLSMRDELTKAE